VSVTRGGSGAGQSEGTGQGTLSDGDADMGYRGPTACHAAGITYRQLDYWARTGLVEPSVRAAHGSGSQRLYSFRDILVLKVVKRLLDTGISLQQIRAAVQHLRDRGSEDLAQVTLMSDGVSVYECTSPDEVVDLLAGGQGVFGIALGRVWQEVAGELAEMPAVRAEDGLIATGDPDELTARRARKIGLAARRAPIGYTVSRYSQLSRLGESVGASRTTAPKGQHFPGTSQAPRTRRDRRL
jgi:DNA-binding transcriptional MerR regulator